MNSLFAAPELRTARPRLPLDGAWSFSYDPDDRGLTDGWFLPGHNLPESIAIPGCSQAHPYESAQGYDRDTAVEIPEQSRTIMLKYGCMHPSWYQRRFTVPVEWKGQAVHLHVGGVKPAADVWINGHALGGTLTSRSPVRCDLTPHLNFGGENTLTLRLHWPRLRLDGVFDIWHAWSGLYRSIWVESVPRVHLADIHVQSTIAPLAATINVRCAGNGEEVRATCTISAVEGGTPYEAEAAAGVDEVKLAIAMPGAKLWSPDEPHLYNATVRLYDGDELLDEATVRFGLREITVRGHQVLLNGTPIFMRGGCDDHIYPQTVCPPADTEHFRERIRQSKKYGFNYVKSAVEVYTPEYLDAADELGYLVCQEMPFGAQAELRELRYNPPPELSELWEQELANIVTADRNHPCVVCYSMTSELNINLENPVPYQWFCTRLPRLARALNPQALIFDVTAGFCGGDATRHGARDTDLIEDVVENSYQLTPLHGRLPVPAEVNKPFFLHEWNWTTALPHPDIIERYRHSPLVPVQIPEMIEAAATNGISHLLPVMAERSRQLKYALRKDALEQAYVHPKIAGYHHWLIHDVCYAPEGVFSEFWDEPADLPASEFCTYNHDTVLIIDGDGTRCYFTSQAVSMNVIAAHFGARPLAAARLAWRLREGATTLAEGTVAVGAVACGERLTVEGIAIPALGGSAPVVGEFLCELWDGDVKIAWNHWTLWFFPDLDGQTVPPDVVATQPLPAAITNNRRPFSTLLPPAGTTVFVTHRWRDAAGNLLTGVIDYIEAGGRVLLLTDGALPEADGDCYRTLPYNHGRTGNMGTVINPHPALGDFPHEGWGDFVWEPLLEGAYPLDLSFYRPHRIEPIIRSIGHHVTMEDKGYLFEIGIGEGILMVCSLNLQPHAHVHAGARYLLHTLIQYLADGLDQPRTVMGRDEFVALLERRKP